MNLLVAYGAAFAQLLAANVPPIEAGERALKMIAPLLVGVAEDIGEAFLKALNTPVQHVTTTSDEAAADRTADLTEKV